MNRNRSLFMFWMTFSLVAAAQATPKLPLRVLVFCHSAGFKHASIPTAEKVMTEIGERTGLFTTVVTQDCSQITAQNLATFNVVFFFTTGELPINDEQKAAFLAYLRNGGGFLGVHSATDTFYKWPAYGEMIGAYFNGHPWHQLVRINVEDHNNAATEDLPDSFQITDEIYQFRDFSRDRVHVLMSLDTNSVDLTLPTVHRTDKDFATTWCREYGKGRVFYTGLGHRDEVWKDPRFQGILLGAVKWLTRADWRSDPAIQADVKSKDVPALVKLSAERPAALRSEPVKALGACASPAADRELAQLAAAGHPTDIRIAALQTLGRRQPEDVTPITAQLSDADGEVRAAAVTALGRCSGAAATEALLSVLQGPDASLHESALAAVAARQDERVAPALMDLLRHPDQAHQGILPQVARALAPQAGKDDVFAALKNAADSPNAGLRDAALQTLAQSQRPEVAQILLPRLFSKDEGTVRSAVAAAEQAHGIDLSAYLTPYIEKWLVVGPFPNPQDKGFAMVYPPEQEQNFSAAYDGIDGKVKWRPAKSKSAVLDLLQVLPKHRENVAAYACATVISPTDKDCELRLGSDDGCRVWLNGREVLGRNVHRGIQLDQDRVAVHLKAGENRLLVKVLQGAGDWKLSARFGNAAGGMAGIRFALPQ